MRSDEIYLKTAGAIITVPERKLIRAQTEEVVRRLGPKITMVNIGIGKGATMHCLRVGAPEALLIGVDSRERNLHPLYEEFLVPLKLILGVSQDPKTQAQIPGPIHVLLIDANHTYECVKEDIQDWTPKLAVGGVVMFHDYSPQEIYARRDPRLRGVEKAVTEWQLTESFWRESGHAGSVIAFERVK